MSKRLLFILITALCLYIFSSAYTQVKVLKANACILYTEKMNYFCIYKPDNYSCKKMINKQYYNEKVIKIWFYFGKYCREFGFQAEFE
jgi:hypothetical protein